MKQTLLITLLLAGFSFASMSFTTIEKPVEIELLDRCPSANFSSSGQTTVGVPVSFSNLSSEATSYLWDFGDGCHCSSENPVHTYTQPGTYQVSLIAIGAGGCTSEFIGTVDVIDD